MRLAAGEPEAEPWRVVPFADLVDRVVRAAGNPTGRPRIVAVDGRSAGGKSTLAARLAAAVPGAAVIHTDDIAWHHSFFDWTDLLAGGLLEPVRRGAEVSFRPPAWDERGRSGSISIPGMTSLVVVEGVGAGRRELMHLIDAVVWVQSDQVEGERRGIARDLADGVNGDLSETIAFWHEWMSEELPFVADQRPWERCCVVVAGTPPLEHAADEVVLGPPPRGCVDGDHTDNPCRSRQPGAPDPAAGVMPPDQG